MLTPKEEDMTADDERIIMAMHHHDDEMLDTWEGGDFMFLCYWLYDG